MDSIIDKKDYRDLVAREVDGSRTGPQYDRDSGFYFFLSLDLVNSTAYKAKNPDWKYRIRMFYDEAKNFWRNHKSSFNPRVWKYVGDEVLFYAKIRSVIELQEAVESSYAAMRTVCRTVTKWTEHSSPSLFVKATCWGAHAEYHEPAPEHDLPTADEPRSRNIVFQSPIGPDDAPMVLDFLGPEIDAGFRITSGSIKKALVVSAEVADVVWRLGKREHGDRLRIIDFRELKGVWNGRHYPIVWYRDDWEKAKLDSDYDYDDRFRFDVLAKAYAAEPTSMKQLEIILGQVDRKWFMDELPLKVDLGEVEEASAVLANPVMEVHCVAVCINDAGQVLVAKRPESKKVYPGCWEAGCAQLRAGEDFHRALARDYYADLNVELDFEPFKDAGPVGNYSFEKHGQTVPGVIFVARATTSGVRAAKHTEARWVDPKALPADVRENGVPGLVERIERALELWTERVGARISREK